MTSSSSSNEVPPLPASEQDFLKSLFAVRSRNRIIYIQSLALAHGESLLPLLEDLLATQPAVHSIPIPRPPKNESELNADGGNPDPVIDNHVLQFPQTNASSRYIQRNAGLAMATNLAQQGSQRAIALLLANLNHPHQPGKKGLIQCLAAHATDKDILAASADSAPAVRDSLVAALTENKRKDLVYDILGKPHPIVKSQSLAPITTRLRCALEQAKEYDRDRVWTEFYSSLDVMNQPGKGICEPGETVKDMILTLQETLPPLYPWDDSNPEQRSPKLASLIENSLVSFIYFDAKRTIRILQKTSWQIRGHNLYSAHIPRNLHGMKKARNYWCRHDNDVLQEYWLSLIAVGNGELVKNGALPQDTLFRCCRGPTADRLIRAALVLLDAEEFKAYSTTEYSKISRLDNILKFAIAGITNLIFRASGCSSREDRLEHTVIFHETLGGLLMVLCSSAHAVLRVQEQNEVSFVARFFRVVLNPLIGGSNSVGYSQISSFPPLGEHVFEQIQDIVFKTKFRKESSVRSIVERLLAILAPRDTSIYNIPNDEYKQPFSAVPPWDNGAVFQTCVADCLDRKDKEMIQLDPVWITHFCNLAPNLTSPQRDKVVEWIMALPSFKPLIGKDEGVSVAPMLDKLFTNTDLRHQLVMPLVLSDKKDKEIDLGDNLPTWAAYVDIRIPSVRALLTKETMKPSFEDRLKWFGAVLKATRLTDDVKEWILTLRWLLPKIRNEIHPNLTSLAPLLLENGGAVPRQYLDKATLDEANELATMYLAMDAQNAAAVTPVSAITRFIDTVSREALWRFADRPSHPFYHLGTEIRWRRQLNICGESTALDNFNLSMGKPTYLSTVTERDEVGEIRRRQLVAKEIKALKTEGGLWGLYVVAEGNEEDFVQGKLEAYRSRWLTVKAVMDPDVTSDGIQSFKEARRDLWRTICLSLLIELGWRWKRSPTLVSYMEETLDVLAKASKKTFGQDTVFNFDWESDGTLYNSVKYVQQVRDIYTDKDWLRENRDKLSWYTRFRNLRLNSTEYAVEVQSRVDECVLNTGQKDRVRHEQLMMELLNKSPSAIHLWQVREFVSKERPDLLSTEQLGMTKGIPGVFNQTETPGPWDFFLDKPAVLDPHQCEVLKARHLLGMTDASTPFQTRVQHAQAFINIPTTTVEDVAKALCTPSLPSRIVEALLMYLPTLGEPASTLPLLLAPVYIQSSLARTSIHAVENALKCVPLPQIPDFILPLFPPADLRQQKVTVQKEGVRLACASMRLVADPKISAVMNDLLARPALHNDVRVVVLQSLLGLLVGPEGREERYRDIVQWIWDSLSSVARSEAHKKSGVGLVLLAVNPPNKYLTRVPRLTIEGLSRAMKVNATLNGLAIVPIPEYLITRYVEDVLIPMSAQPTGENKDDTNLIEVRVLTLQLLAYYGGWLTDANAPRMAKFWRQEASSAPLEGDKDQLWVLSARGIGHCVGKEVESALASGQEGNTAWKELVGLVQDQVDTFLDKTLRRALRKLALQRITSLTLETNFVPQNFEEAKKAGVFSGDDLDLSRPLLSKAMESVAWKIALQRELTVFNPQEGMTQDQINEEALRILLRIADYSNRHLSTVSETVGWVGQKLLSKVSNNIPLRKFIAKALINPCDDLIDWVHLNDVTENIMCSVRRVFSLSEISSWVERLACQDTAAFYWTKRKGISDLITSEIQTQFEIGHRELTATFLSSVTEVLSPIVKRAQAAGWIAGPDATIVRSMLRTNAQVLCAAFPRDIGPLLHHNIVHAVKHSDGNGSPAHHFMQDIQGVAAFGWKATGMGHLGGHINVRAEISGGFAPSSVLITEACLNGKLGELDLTPFMASNNLPLDVLRGEWFRFRDNGDSKKPLIKDQKNPSTLKELEAHWNKIMATYVGYFKPLQQAVAAGPEKNSSPALRQAYQDIAVNLISQNSKFVLVRPFVYLEYMRLALTSPDTTISARTIATHLISAFTPVKESGGDGFSYAWAPPLGLALDMADYLLHEIRDDAATEGEREARLIEQMTAMFLSGWMTQTVKTAAGKLLAAADDIKALETRYLVLVEELCEDGTGGQSLALQLDDFVPGDPSLVA